MRRPFEVAPRELAADLDDFVNATLTDLQAPMLTMPRGSAFIEYTRFRDAYKALKRATSAVHNFTPATIWQAMQYDSLVFVVLRTMLGLTPGEWAGLAAAELDSDVDENTARALDSNCRMRKDYVASPGSGRASKAVERIKAMSEVAHKYLAAGAPAGAVNAVHRFDKVDTSEGLESLQFVAAHHVPYAVLLYERYLGLLFITHRNFVSRLIGEVLESEIELRLEAAGTDFYKTRLAEKVPDFGQAPDFLVPDYTEPEVVIEAKVANDAGTARDKVDRVLRLVELNRRRVEQGRRSFQVIACIEGRGLGVRRERMKTLLKELDGKVFTTRTLDRLITHIHLARYVSRS